MSYTLVIIVATVLISISAFNNGNIYNKLILWPRVMESPNEYYRLLTSGFIHADYMHLIFNMLTLYFFGDAIESIFTLIGHHNMFLLLYIAGIIVASLPSFLKNRNNSYYRSLGASGGVAAVLFAFTYFAPWATIYLFWFVPVPSILAGVGFLVYSAYMSKRGGGFINHDAHFWGAVFGFVFAFIVDPSHGHLFLQNLMHPHF